MKGKIALILSVLLLLCSCKGMVTKNNMHTQTTSSGIWFSFSEINEMLMSENGFEAELSKATQNCKSLKIENVYIHVRSYCDSLYPSRFFPLITKAEGYSYDLFKMMLEAFHQSGIKVHAWVNPYRVLTSSGDIENLRKDNPAYKWLKDENAENDINVCFYNGIYLNPAEPEVQKLILSGIKEILENYNVDGIHLDDYFYPTKNEEFDSKSYEKYKISSQNPLPLDDWRRFNVNSLISGCYSLIKSYDEKIVFSVSPAASIEKNYTELYADVNEWIASGYIDAIIPQLYFGFNYKDEAYQFENLLKKWCELCEQNKNVKLLIGLAAYKIGSSTEADGTEWQTDTDIIACQAEKCYKNGAISGYVLFSYSSVFAVDELNSLQRTELLRVVNDIGGEIKNE